MKTMILQLLQLLQYTRLLCSVVCLGVLFCGAGPGYAQSASGGVGERVGAAAQNTKATVQEAGAAAVNKIDEIWRRVDERRLKNRTRDEFVAWILVGLLVGNFIGMLSAKPSTLPQRLGTVVGGLIGAFAGGIVAHVCQLDLGMGPVLIRYEDLLFSVVGGLLLVAGVRIWVAQKRKRALVRASQAVAKP